tara:strand:- start:35 stop:1165 length:1131 start_codon:yes stop_codon:yes gene_type:complete
VEIRGAFLLVHQIPYVSSAKVVQRGTLVSTLSVDGERSGRPSDHTAHFIGEFPCDSAGTELVAIKAGSQTQRLDTDLIVNHYFSSKPKIGHYADYYEKITTYAAILSSPAATLDDTATARVYAVIEPDPDDEEAVFNYLDTNSGRAKIAHISNRLRGQKIGIIGVGGSGSYVLDLVAKTPVKEIHLYDDDIFSNHSAFRAPGAASIDELRVQPKKVAYFAEEYSKLHRSIRTHDCKVTEENFEALDGLDFVFLCIDNGSAKSAVFEKLEAMAIPFIDVGMGIATVDESLIGILRVTTSTPDQRKHVYENGRVSFSSGADDDAYDQNIQIAELNALCATLAVIKWKKLCGFYQDLIHEHHCTYSLNDAMLLNDDFAA